MNQRRLQLIEIGSVAKALVELHLEQPKEYPAEYILERLLSEYQKMKEGEVNA